MYAQDDCLVIADMKGMQDSFFYLQDSVLRREIGSFNFIGSFLGKGGKAELLRFEVSEFSRDRIILTHDTISVFIGSTTFFPRMHQLEFNKEWNFLYRIDQKPYWGIEGRVPHRRIAGVFLSFDNTNVSIPYRDYRDLFEPNLCRRTSLFGRLVCRSEAFMSEDGRRIYIYMRNGTIPSLYEVTWIIEDGEYIGRVVDFAY